MSGNAVAFGGRPTPHSRLTKRLINALEAALEGRYSIWSNRDGSVGVGRGLAPDLHITFAEGWAFEGGTFAAEDIAGVRVAVMSAIARRARNSSGKNYNSEQNRESAK